MQKLKKFLSEVMSEAKKTTWPNKDELLASTGVVLFILAVSGIYLFLVDLLFAGTLGALLKMF